MKETFDRIWERVRNTLSTFTTGQKAIAGIGVAALLLAAFLVVRWVSTPSYAPLYTNLASSDASAVIDQLNTQNIPYKLTSGGSTIMVPQQDVYSTRISLSGKGLPGSSSSGGYSILDKSSLSTSDFAEQTNFKRAMEAELNKTIESINGIQTAIVHLAMPPQQVFADKQQPATASVLLQLQSGQTLSSEQVQAVVHLVASSIDGLDPSNVTVTDSNGNVLSVAGQDPSMGATGQADQVAAFQNEMSTKVQSMLDRVLGPGNSNVQVTADLNFDKAVTESTRYYKTIGVGALSAASSVEKYKGTGTPGSASGVVGPDGQMETGTTTTGGNGKYSKTQKSSDNAVDKVVEQREAAPGAVKSLHIGVAVDTLAAGQISPAQLRQLISSSLGINTKRGDTVDVSTLPFNRTVEKQQAAELKAAAQSASIAKRNEMIRDVVIALLACLVLFFLWWRGRKKAQARAEATSYVVEQLRLDAAERAAATQVLDNPNPALAALESAEDELNRETREEIAALVERQPEDVAALLRGWLVDRT